MDNEPIYRGRVTATLEGNQIRLPADSSYHKAADPLYATKMIFDDERWIDVHPRKSSGVEVPLELIVKGQTKKLKLPPDIQKYLGIGNGSQVVLLASGQNFFELWEKQTIDNLYPVNQSSDESFRSLELRGIRLD